MMIREQTTNCYPWNNIRAIAGKSWEGKAEETKREVGTAISSLHGEGGVK